MKESPSTSLSNKQSSRLPIIQDDNEVHQDVEALGATRFGLYTDYGFNDQLENICENYADYYRDRINVNQNTIVQNFLDRNFEDVLPCIQRNEHYIFSPFQKTISLGKSICEIN